MTSDPADHKSHFPPGSFEEVFGEFGVGFGEPELGLTAVTSVSPVVRPLLEDTVVNCLC